MRNVVQICTAIMLLVVFAGCVSQSTVVNPTNNVPATPAIQESPEVLADSGGFGIQAPLGLPHQATEASNSKDGDQYETGWPSQRVEASGTGSLIYSPQCEDADPPFGDMSYAMYSLMVPEPADFYTILFDWQGTGHNYNDLWLGLADFENNDWDWQQGEDSNEILFTADGNVNESGQVYLVVVCLGNTPWELNLLTISSVQLVIESVSPLTGNPAEEVSFSAVVVGGIPGEDVYAWDFGGGATPNTSSDTAPTVTSGAAGSYDCVLDVSNQYSSDQFVFMFVVGSPPIADLQADPTTTPPITPVFLDASSSTDPDGSVVQYDWDWDSDGNYEIEDGASTQLHTYSSPGLVTTTVRVWDNDGASDTESVEIQVVPLPAPGLVVLPGICDSDINEIQLFPSDPKVRRNGEMAYLPLTGEPIFADEEAFFDVLKDSSDFDAEFPIEFDQDSLITYPIIVVVEGANPNTITGPDDPNDLAGAYILSRQANKLTVDIAVLPRPVGMGDPNIQYAFRLYNKVGMALGEGTFECTLMPLELEDAVAIDWSVNLWDRVEGTIDDLGPDLHDAAGGVLDGTTVGTETPDVLWFEFSGGWVFGGAMNDPISIRVDTVPPGDSALFDLRLEIAGLDMDNHFLGFHTVVLEDFYSVSSPAGLLRSGGLYEFTPYDPMAGDPSDPFDRLMIVTGSPF